MAELAGLELSPLPVFAECRSLIGQSGCRKHLDCWLVSVTGCLETVLLSFLACSGLYVTGVTLLNIFFNRGSKFPFVRLDFPIVLLLECFLSCNIALSSLVTHGLELW